jgi:hypothetical protein
MLVHEPYGPIAGMFDAMWMTHVFYLALAFVCCAIGWVVLRFVVWRRRSGPA